MRSRRNEAVKELRTTKTGSTYWYYPKTVAKRMQKVKDELQKLKEEHKAGKEISEYNTIETKVNVIKLDSRSDEHYLRYVEKKKAIREQYGRWSQMDRKQTLEYYKRIGDLLFHDEDFQYYFREVKKSFDEKVLDMNYKKMKEKEDSYDGHLDGIIW